LQLPYPGAQFGEQRPFAHEAPTACCSEQVNPQAPQFVIVVTLVSQPSLAALALQSPNPVRQVGAHTLSSQLALLTLSRLHATSQEPQRVGVEVMSVSQPSFGPPAPSLQSSNPVRQMGSHAPVVQMALEAFRTLHVTPQAPQSVTVEPSGIPTSRSVEHEPPASPPVPELPASPASPAPPPPLTPLVPPDGVLPVPPVLPPVAPLPPEPLEPPVAPLPLEPLDPPLSALSSPADNAFRSGKQPT